MKDLPHLYQVNVSGAFDSNLLVQADNLVPIEVAPPIEFDGPGDLWSPETLLLAAVANCFVLSFKAVAKAAKFIWLSIECEPQGTLDRVGREIRFTQINIHAKLTLSEGSDVDKAEILLHKAEKICLISNSLLAEKQLNLSIVIKK